MRTNACGCRSCTRFLTSLTDVQYLAWLRLTERPSPAALTRRERVVQHYEAGLRPLSWMRTHLLGWPVVLPPHEAQVRPAGASAYGADVEGVA